MVAPEFVFIGGAAVIGGAVWMFQRASARKRREAYTEYCLIRGFQYNPQQPDGERRFRDGFEPFQHGNSKSWRNTIAGVKNGAAFTAFEYQWTTGSGKSRRTNTRSGIIWERGDAGLPRFELQPEDLLSRLRNLFGTKDIDFFDSPEFSKAYRLEGPDESAIRKLFTPEIRRFFESTLDQRVTAGGRFLIWWFSSKLPDAAALDEWLEQGDHVRRRFFNT